MSNWVPGKVRREIVTLLLAGFSIRKTAAECKVSKNTVLRYRAIIQAAELFGDDMRLPMCECGQAASHKGWCAHRFRKSKRRQEFIATWKRKQL